MPSRAIATEEMTTAMHRRALVPSAHMRGTATMRLALAALSLGAAGCFAGYDSRWGQQKQAEKHVAEHSTPKQLQTLSGANGARVAERSLRLRVYATPSYAASVVDWQKQFGDLLDCANSVLVPDFGISFGVPEFRTFRVSSEEHLEGALSELRALDDGRDVDWVVGLVASEPRFAVSADDLGMAPLLGHHLVLRAMNDAREYEAIEQAFGQLSEDERMKLYRTRKRHKWCTVFLHEIAHTLGVPHERAEASLMNSRYQYQATGFSDEAGEIVRASLAARADPARGELDAPLARALRALLEEPNSDWQQTSRDVLLGLLSQAEGSSPSEPIAVAASPATPTVSGPVIAGLSADEQQIYDRAETELKAGRAESARELAVPLFQKHPQLPALDSLRCEIAMGIGGDWDAISSQCPGMSPFGGH
jgi:hypothetical protein